MYLLDDFKNPQGNLKHITIGMPTKKSGWRVNLQMAGIVSKAVALSGASLQTALDTLFPIMLDKKSDLTKRASGEKLSKAELKAKYKKELEDSLKNKEIEFSQREKVKPLKKQKSLAESIFKKSGEPRFFRIREPYQNTSIAMQVTRGGYARNYSLVEHTIRSAVNDSFEHIVKSLDCDYSKPEYQAVKVTLINRLIDKYDQLCNEVGETGLRSKFDSLAGEFYKNGKWHCFSVLRNSRYGENLYVQFNKQGSVGMSRSLEKYGFESAFQEIFRHGCKQVGINPEFIAMQPIKSLLKEHLRQQMKIT